MDDDRLQFDYDQTTQLLRTLVDVRFKLLAFVPTIAGAAVAFFGRPRPAAELLGVGLVGLVATLGIFVYELGNSQQFDRLARRAAELERRLELSGGLFGQQPRAGKRLFGLIAVRQERGLALVYAAAFAGWSYLTAWGALRALDIGGARKVGALVGLAVAPAVVFEVERLRRRAAEEA
ncbi:MAG TPA: hypothetical protein VGJ77_00690 [Gaiellaceae bacterium]